MCLQKLYLNTQELAGNYSCSWNISQWFVHSLPQEYIGLGCEFSLLQLPAKKTQICKPLEVQFRMLGK